METQNPKINNTTVKKNPKTIVVCGATGTQGSAVVERLLKSKEAWHIVALTRDIKSTKAQELNFRGVEVKKADLSDKESLIRAFKGAYGVFAVTQPWSADNKHCYPEKEVQQGINIVDACAHNHIKQVVYSSVLNFTSKPINIPHVDSKLKIEDYLKSKNLPYSIIRLPQFMENLGQHFFPVKKGLIKGLVDADAKVPYICSKDIGKFVSLAFADPGIYLGKEINVIGDMVSGEELSSMMSSIRKGERFRYKSVPKLLMRIFAKEFYNMRVFFETYGRAPYKAQPERILEESKMLIPELISMKDYLLLQKFDSMAID